MQYCEHLSKYIPAIAKLAIQVEALFLNFLSLDILLPYIPYNNSTIECTIPATGTKKLLPELATLTVFYKRIKYN